MIEDRPAVHPSFDRVRSAASSCAIAAAGGIGRATCGGAAGGAGCGRTFGERGRLLSGARGRIHGGRLRVNDSVYWWIGLNPSLAGSGWNLL